MIEDITYQKLTIDLFICVNDRSNDFEPKSSCGPTITKEMVKDVKIWVRSQGFPVRVTATYCQGGCNPDGGTCTLYPSGRWLKGLRTVEDMKRVILDEVGAK